MIKLNNIYKEYENKNTKKVALKNITLSLPNCGFVIIYGTSGSGKTTLLNIISTLDTPTSGNLETSLSSNDYSTTFQDSKLIDYLTIIENIKMVSQLYNFSNVENIIKTFRIQHILNKYPNQISGGEKQRVALIIALIQNKKVLLCDEPTGSLDLKNSIIVGEYLKKEGEKRLVIVVTHDIECFYNLADRVIKIENGVIKSDLTLNESQSISSTHTYKKNKLSFSFIRYHGKNITKNNTWSNKISSLITILMFFLVMICSILTTTKLNLVVNNIYSKNNLNAIDLVEEDSDYLSVETLNFLDENNLSYTYFFETNSSYTIDNISFNRLYLSDCFYEMLYGNNIINDYELIISDKIASNIATNKNISIESVIGYQITSFEEWEVDAIYTVVGIFSTGYLENDLSHNPYYRDCFYCNLFCTDTFKSTLNNILTDSTSTNNIFSKEGISLHNYDISIIDSLLDHGLTDYSHLSNYIVLAYSRIILINYLMLFLLTILILILLFRTISDVQQMKDLNSQNIGQLMLLEINKFNIFIILMYLYIRNVLISILVSIFLYFLIVPILNICLFIDFPINQFLSFNFYTIIFFLTFIFSIYFIVMVTNYFHIKKTKIKDLF